MNEEIVDPAFPTLRPLTSNQLNGESSSNLFFSPGIRAQLNQFGVAFAFENVLQYNLTQDVSTSQNLRINSNISYEFKIPGKMNKSALRSIVYYRTDPHYDDQVGGSVLFMHPKFWIQGGYNSFYGPSGGVGVNLFKNFSFGALVEISTTNNLSDKDYSFEIQASMRLGSPKILPEPELKDLADDSSREQEQLDKELREKQRLERLEMIRKQDSLINARLREQRRLDSIARLAKVQIRPDEKYEEVASMQGLKPGYYLITNVFGTDRYFRTFMESLRKRGLEPKSFKRSLNGYNYVYLERYDNLDEIREARDSKFYGKYRGPTWIFRVKE